MTNVETRPAPAVLSPDQVGSAIEPRNERNWRRLFQKFGDVAVGAAVICGYLAYNAYQEINLPSVDAAALPAKLPEAVGALVANEGQVVNQIYQHEPSAGGGNLKLDFKEWIGGSGVEFKPGYVLTAGHMLHSGTSSPLLKPDQCNYVIYNSGTDVERAVKTEAATYQYGDNGTVPDIGLLALNGFNSNADDYLPHIKLATRSPRVGQSLFFVNYEPTRTGKARDPAERSSHIAYSKPAIYGGIYTGNEPNGDYEVLTGIKNYGVIDDKSTRPGASGGAVFNSNGRLVGLSVQVSNTSSPPTETDMYFGVNLGGAAGSDRVGLTLVQPVNEADIKSLEKGLERPSSCS